jgi:DNA-binding GntR family transcriptional regulator
MSILTPVRPSTLKIQASAAVRDAIFRGRLRPGDPLRELHLARELEVSQPTVREALLELEKAGLVIRKPNSGTVVRNMSAKEVRDRLEVRRQLEIMAAVAASRRMTGEDFAELDRRLNALNAAVASNAYYEAAQADLEFHRWIWDCSGNSILSPAFEQISTPLFAFVSLLRSRSSERLKEVTNAHAPIVAALRRKREAGIAGAIAQHFKDSYEEFLNSGVQDCRTYAEAAAP